MKRIVIAILIFTAMGFTVVSHPVAPKKKTGKTSQRNRQYIDQPANYIEASSTCTVYY